MTISKKVITQCTFTFNSKEFTIEGFNTKDQAAFLIESATEEELGEISNNIYENLKFFIQNESKFKVENLVYSIDVDGKSCTITFKNPYQPIEVSMQRLENILNDIINTLAIQVYEGQPNKELEQEFNKRRENLIKTLDEFFTNV